MRRGLGREGAKGAFWVAKKSSVRTGVLGDTSFRLVLFYLLSDSICLLWDYFSGGGLSGQFGQDHLLMTLMMFEFVPLL